MTREAASDLVRDDSPPRETDPERDDAVPRDSDPERDSSTRSRAAAADSIDVLRRRSSKNGSIRIDPNR
jgi:hypothetical protein